MATPADLDDLLPDLEGIEGENLRGLIERAHQIALLTQHPGWPIYADYLIGLTTSAQTRIFEGHVQDMEEYRKLVGFISGIREALQASDKLQGTIQALREQAAEDAEDVDSWP